MKRLIFSLLILILCTAFVTPPAFPSTFWGYAVGIPAGATVNIYSGSVILAHAHVLNYSGMIGYGADVMNGQEGDLLQFRYQGSLVGSGVYHAGINQRVDIIQAAEKRIKRGK
jgi:hypothetical protein